MLQTFGQTKYMTTYLSTKLICLKKFLFQMKHITNKIFPSCHSLRIKLTNDINNLKKCLQKNRYNEMGMRGYFFMLLINFIIHRLFNISCQENK